ncbi:hypothetical protein BKA61DRAFT_578124 [Leptodontidium sp. MPI-SDFR-AT-0119]|nr:hypothetical protein BKA61DRAFT_578124 [Leptodontidium sp. MPI-SDFR-AT-0119]
MTSTGTGWPWSSRRSQDCEEDAEKKFHRVSHRSRLEGAIRDNELTADALAADGAIRESSTARLQDECSYVMNDRVVRVNERILEECENAKQVAAAAIAATSSPTTVSSDSYVLPEAGSELRISNPLVEDKAWFVPITTVDNPVYIGECAGSSLATGIRRALDSSCSRSAHPPRHHYVSDGSLVLYSTDSMPRPNKAKASLLVKVALTYVSR